MTPRLKNCTVSTLPPSLGCTARSHDQPYTCPCAPAGKLPLMFVIGRARLGVGGIGEFRLPLKTAVCYCAINGVWREKLSRPFSTSTAFLKLILWVDLFLLSRTRNSKGLRISILVDRLYSRPFAQILING